MLYCQKSLVTQTIRKWHRDYWKDQYSGNWGKREFRISMVTTATYLYFQKWIDNFFWSASFMHRFTHHFIYTMFGRQYIIALLCLFDDSWPIPHTPLNGYSLVYQSLPVPSIVYPLELGCAWYISINQVLINILVLEWETFARIVITWNSIVQ